jgi:hypothetical protein
MRTLAPIAERAFARVQPKLAIARAHGAYEHEADAVAAQVMRAPAQHAEPAGAREALVPSAAPGAAHPFLPAQGQPLDAAARRFMEPRFGHDFSRVRVHTGPAAVASARSMDAQAYTVGSHIAFDAGRYAPANASGRELLAHELTHVVQQAGSASAGIIQRKVNAIRFQDEPTLKEVSEGTKVLKETDRGEAVVRVTIALHELGHYPIDIIDESFDPPLTGAVMKYQNAKGLKGKAVAGTVDKPTFTELDNDFSAAYRIERDVLSKQKSPDLLKNTQSLDDKERAAAARAISTEARVNPVTGALPTFNPEIPKKGKYKNRLKKVVEDVILAEYKMYGKGKAAAHADSTKLFDWPIIGVIALESQKATDSVFGEYTKAKSPPPLQKDVNIKDAWDDKVLQLTAGGKAKEDAAADWRVEKILTGDDSVARLDEEHGAIQSRVDEKPIVADVKSAMITKYRTELIETHKGWPGYADPDKGKIYIQRFKETNKKKEKDANRWSMWDFYQTFIHEYIHTIEHKDHVTWRKTMAAQKGGFTLREGTADYFTKIVWNGITINDALRKKIEGPYHDPVDKFAVQKLNVYKESKNAERLAGIVGLRNLAAAFFLGNVELIGKK